MKKILTLLIFCGLFTTFTAQGQPDYFQGSVKVELTASGPFAVFYIKLTSVNASLNTGFTGVEFFLTYSDSYTLTFGSVVNNTTDFPGISVLYGGQNPWGSITGKVIEWFYFTGVSTTATTYTAGQEYEVFRVPISTASQHFGDVNIEYDGTSYVTYLVITNSIGAGLTTADLNLDEPVFYGPETYSGSNGSGIVGGGSAVYSIFDKPLVPMVLWEDAVWAGGSGTGNEPGVGDGTKPCYVRDASGNITQTGGVVNQLNIVSGADLTIDPDADLTANGATHIEDANGLTIASTTDGTGSFIDNGTITYGASGSATVQTYIENGALAGDYFAHLVGGTLNDPVFETNVGAKGVYLGEFDLNGNTYAYDYIESTNSWNNIYLVTDPIPTSIGILLSTIDNTSYTLSMTGELITGPFTALGLAHGTNNLDLRSNPFPSSIDFDLLYGSNTSSINNTYYVYDPLFGDYRSYNTNSGGDATKNIQVGQGFFVETLSTTPLTYTNSMRLHSTDPFYKNSYANQLRLDAEGGDGFRDASFVYFNEAGTNGFDDQWDVNKWWSMQSQATEIWTIDEDGSLLSMNVLPELGPSMVSVPMSFKCGEEGDYTISATQIESFENGTEIWLEDVQTGDPWHNLVENPVYEFAAAPDDPEARFVVHFFGPTGIEDLENESPIFIYSYDHDAYIVNRGEEVIEEYVVYDMMGRELQRGTLPNSTVNRVTIGNTSAYYIVKVVTNNRIYSEKVFINR